MCKKLWSANQNRYYKMDRNEILCEGVDWFYPA
jgi:hypothetical protein